MKKLILLFLLLSVSAVAQLTITYNGLTSQSLTITAGQVGLAGGGTNASLSASNGGMVYSTGSALAILAGTATANQIPMSGASSAPAWSTATYPATTTVNQILYSSSNNALAGLATANNGVLITSGAGVPSVSSSLPSAVQTNITAVGTIATGVWNGTPLTSAYLPNTPYCAANVVSFSATPAFNLASGCPEITLTGNVTSFTVSGMSAGMMFDIHVCQNGTGGYTMSGAPSSLHGFFTIGTTASKCSDEWFRVDNTGSTAFPMGAIINQ